MLAGMSPRTLFGAAGAFAFVAVLAHTTAATQCPVRTVGPCQRVHELVMRPRAVGPIVLAASPMRGGLTPIVVAALR
jgi:hypothetical protein